VIMVMAYPERPKSPGDHEEEGERGA